jgi:hypothetical protein
MRKLLTLGLAALTSFAIIACDDANPLSGVGGKSEIASELQNTAWDLTSDGSTITTENHMSFGEDSWTIGDATYPEDWNAVGAEGWIIKAKDGQIWAEWKGIGNVDNVYYWDYTLDGDKMYLVSDTKAEATNPTADTRGVLVLVKQ